MAPFKSIFFQTVWLISLILVLFSCQKSVSLTDDGEVSVKELDRLTEAITSRDTGELWYLAIRADSIVQSLAWRSSAITGFHDVDLLMSHAIGYNEPGAWYALRFQELTQNQIDDLSLRFYNHQIPKRAACNIFYRHGDDRTLEMLLADPKLLMKKKECSGAVGGILSRVKVSQSLINRVIDLVIESESDQAAENMLYGFWRSPVNRPEPGSANSRKLLQMFLERSDHEPVYTDEYLVRLTGTEGAVSAFKRVIDHPDILPTQFVIETARAIRTIPPEKVQEHVLYLLNRENPHIGVMALESMQQISGLDVEWLNNLANQMIHYPEHHETALSYMELLLANEIPIERRMSRLDRIDVENPYLKNRVLRIYKSAKDQTEFIQLLKNEMASEGVGALHATGILVDWVREGEMNAELREFARDILIKALEQQNRSVLSISEPLLTNPLLFDQQDEVFFNRSLNAAIQNGNRSVAEQLLSILESMGLTESYADIDIPEKPFRNPDWNRLSELGDKPHWILDTNRGRIVIQLDPHSAPFTVSSIDHLTSEGYFDRVHFHRVVRNFVIQGGDFDRKDGFGGPNYRIPTEPSFQTFSRGSVGMASSGPDTEGSQFFITHTRTPHLDGLYTIFGQVIEGMDVVDRIEMGDVVLRVEVIGGEK